MSRTGLLWIKLIVLTLTLILVLGFLFRGIMGNGFNFSPNQINFFGFSILSGDSTMSGKTYEFENIDEIEIYAVALDIVIEEHDGENIILTDNTIVKNSSGETNNTVNKNGSKLYFEQPSNFPTNPPKGEVIIKVPKGSVIDYTLSTARNITVDVENLGSDNEISTVDGKVIVNGAGEKLRLNSIDGDIEVKGAYNEIKADSVDGNLNIMAGGITEEISINTIDGSAIVTLTDDVKYNVEFTSLSGSFIPNKNYETSHGSDLQIDYTSISGGLSILD